VTAVNESSTVTKFIQRRAATTPSEPTATTTRELPHDLLIDASRRLQVLCLLYSFLFFMANFFFTFVMGLSGQIFARWESWVPGVLSISVGLIVFAIVRSARLEPRRIMDIGLVFGAIASYGIATAEYLSPLLHASIGRDNMYFMGLSWVAVWMIIVPVIVPNSPRKTLFAALVSAASMPAVFAVGITFGNARLELNATSLLFVTYPYLLVALTTYLIARVVYKLGAAVTRARELGSYELVEMLGSGGMGEVWHARHRMLVRPAAVKLVRPEMLGGSSESAWVALKRFEREAQATAAMRSPHTIQLYDFGIAEDGTFYYVMEMLDGFDTETLVGRFGPLAPERALHILGQMCHSLAEAHATGLIHRDIKPANVFLCRYGREVDFVKVLDFGLVKSRGEQSADEVKLTAANVTGGTPAFMAPEQALGDRPVDERTDIYALGCMGYWLLTGQLVFEGDTPLQTIMHHVHTAPEPPSARVELPIPATLDRLVLSCLEKDPARRPQSIDELARQIGACDIAGTWTEERARQWWATYAPASGRQATATEPTPTPRAAG
jgi:serine/threonine-protein kinase